jgi:hypothetical protein
MWDYVTPQDFGAIGDGVTDDSPAFQAALNSGNPVWVPHRPSGYYIKTTLYLNGGTVNAWQVFAGDDGTTLISDNSTALLSIPGSPPNGPGTNHGWYVSISGFRFLMPSATQQSGSPPPTAILLNSQANPSPPPPTPPVNLAFHRYSDLLFDSCISAISDVTVPATTKLCTDIHFMNCKCWQVRGNQVTITKSAGQILFRDFYIDLSQNSSLPNGTVLASFGPTLEGLEFERLDITAGDLISPLPTGVIGLHVFGPAFTPPAFPTQGAVFLTRVLVDSFPGQGILLENLLRVIGKDIEVYAALGNPSSGSGLPGFRMNYVYESSFTNVLVNGYNSGPPPLQAASANGLELDNCVDVSMANVIGGYNTGNGIYINGCTNVQAVDLIANSNSANGLLVNASISCRFSNVETWNNTQWGINEIGAQTNNIVIVNASSAGNHTGSLNQMGAGSATCCWVPNSGAFTQFTLGTTSV